MTIMNVGLLRIWKEQLVNHFNFLQGLCETTIVVRIAGLRAKIRTRDPLK